MLSRRQTVDTRLEAHTDVGTHERPKTSLSEAAANRLALEGVQVAQAHRQEVAKNEGLVKGFMNVLVSSTVDDYNRIDVPVGDLDQVKRLQSSLVWGGWYVSSDPNFIVGSRQTKNPSISSLLLAEYPLGRNRHGRLQRIDVDTRDLEVAESFMATLPKQEYSLKDIQLLTNEGRGAFSLADEHPKSTRLVSYEYRFFPFQFTLSRKILAPKIERGIRSRSQTVLSNKPLPVPELTDRTIEDYGVMDRLADLAVIFGKENELRYLVGDRPTQQQTATR